jgi:hypothetical protein
MKCNEATESYTNGGLAALTPEKGGASTRGGEKQTILADDVIGQQTK